MVIIDVNNDIGIVINVIIWVKKEKNGWLILFVLPFVDGARS